MIRDSSTEEPTEGGIAGGPDSDQRTLGSLRERVAGQAKELARSRITQRKSRSATDLGNLANALRQTGQQLAGNIALPLVNGTADRLEHVAQLLDTTDPAELAHGVERFARRDPLLFLGGAFALGVVGARFVKSSALHAQSVATSSAPEPGMDDLP
jgi:hypothetical protein